VSADSVPEVSVVSAALIEASGVRRSCETEESSARRSSSVRRRISACWASSRSRSRSSAAASASAERMRSIASALSEASACSSSSSSKVKTRGVTEPATTA